MQKSSQNRPSRSQQRREQIVQIMVDPANDHLRRHEIAELVGITERQLYKYLRDEGLWFEARELRRAARAEWLCKTDTALFKKAIEGDVAAARLVYQRWEGLGQPGTVVNIDLVSNFVKKLTVSLLEELARELGCPNKAASLLKRVLAQVPETPLGQIALPDNSCSPPDGLEPRGGAA